MQDLVGVRVADAGDQRLVGERALQLPGPALEQDGELLPVDVEGPGTYALLVGPLDDWWADQPTTFVVNLPPDATFWATNWTSSGVVTGPDGLRYLSMDLTVEAQLGPDRPFEPYPGMTVWIY